MDTIPPPLPAKTREENASLQRLFPNASNEELEKLDDVFYGYLEIVWDIYRETKRTHPEHFDKTKDQSRI